VAVAEQYDGYHAPLGTSPPNRIVLQAMVCPAALLPPLAAQPRVTPVFASSQAPFTGMHTHLADPRASPEPEAKYMGFAAEQLHCLCALAYCSVNVPIKPSSTLLTPFAPTL
jgi:hypothetical protein